MLCEVGWDGLAGEEEERVFGVAAMCCVLYVGLSAVS